MALQLRRVTEEQRQVSTFVPVIGEPVYAYDSGRLYIGDGSTVGGVDIANVVSLQDFLGIDLSGENIGDGWFIYYLESDGQWHIGQPTIYTSDLADVTTDPDLAADYMIAYDTSTQKWLIQERLSKSITEVEEFEVVDPYPGSGRLLLQYNETTEKFESIVPPTAPTPAELDGMESTVDPSRGHLWLYSEADSAFKNDYIVGSQSTNTYANLHDVSALDIISYSSNGLWEKETPFLKDVDLISMEGLDEPEPTPITIVVSADSDGNFLLDGSRKPDLTLRSDTTYIFDLSDSVLAGKTFRLSLVPDGTHDPSGAVLTDPAIVEVAGTEGVDGTLTLFRNLEIEPKEFGARYYYFCVEEPERGNFVVQYNYAFPFAMTWDDSLGAYHPVRFDKGLDDLGDVIFDYDDDGLIRDKQILAWNAGLQKWTTPGNMIPGVTGELPRRQSLRTAAVWTGEFAGVGSFDIGLPPDSQILSMGLDIGEDDEADMYLFPNEELREDFFELLDELLEGVEETIESIAAAAAEAAERLGVKKLPFRGPELKYAGPGNSLGGPSKFGSVYGGSGEGGGAGGGGGTDLTPGSFPGGGMGGGGLGIGGPCSTLSCGEGTDEPGLDEFITYMDPLEAEELLRDAYTNLEKNLNKIIGVLVARSRAIEELLGPQAVAGGGGDTLGIGVNHGAPVSDAAPPMIFGWRPSTDVYSYYLFTFESSASSLQFNTANHYLEVQSRMRRVGAIVGKDTTFRVLFYYDADDTRYKAGPWLRIIEYQRGPADYTGNLSEFPSYYLRQNIDEYNPSQKYGFGTRVLHNDQLWELMLETATGIEPASGTELAPTTYEGDDINMFVEIPAFSVKSQVFNAANIGQGVYQMRVSMGVNADGGKTHPAFQFGNDEYDDADFIYVGVDLLDQNGRTRLDWSSGGSSTNYKNVRLDTRAGHRSFLNAQSYDIGMFLYDINVHSAIQHLMVGEFQTFNVESRLGQCDLVNTQRQYYGEHQFSLDLGNASGCTQSNDSYSNPAGIVSYRGIHRPYGNQGFHLDSINIRSDTGAARISKDPLIPNDIDSEPATFYEIETLPRPSLDSNGDGAAFISNFFTFRRVDFSDFVYYLPKILGGSYNSYLGDRIKYRRLPTSDSPAFASCGCPYQSPIDQVAGENGPFNLNISPATGFNHVFGTRLCVKRRGAPKQSTAIGTLTQSLGTTRDENGDIVSQNAPPPYAIDADGNPTGPAWPEGWSYEETSTQVVSTTEAAPSDELDPGQTWELTEVVVGNDKSSNGVGTSTVSVARKVLSKSAICIAVIDETSPKTRTYFEPIWDEFRQEYPDRDFWLLLPLGGTDADDTKPFPTSALENPYSGAFLNSEWRPVSYNQRSSSPLTYDVTARSEWSEGPLSTDPVWVTENYSTAPELGDEAIDVVYKIRVPVEAFKTKFRFNADNQMTVKLYNPVTDVTTVIGSSTTTYSGSTPSFPEEVVFYDSSDSADLFDMSGGTGDEWLELRVTVLNTDLATTSLWTGNPAAFGLEIEACEDTLDGDPNTGTWYSIFNASDYSVKNSLDTILGVPANFMEDAALGGPTNGPYRVTRDSGNESLITDWFKLCQLDRLQRGTVVGLFVDRSGSMTQATIAASYEYFYEQCEAAGLTVREVTNTVEDWVTPFITEL